MRPLLLTFILLVLNTSGDPLQGRQWALAAMGVPGAWAQLVLPLVPVSVAVLDSGMCADLSDLAGRILPGYDFIDNDSEPQDTRGQGCALASIIAAQVGDGVGMAGIAPNAHIMPLRVVDANGIASAAALAAGLRFAAENGARLIVIGTPLAEASALVNAAIDEAVRAGALVIAAAGDSGGATLPTAAYHPVVAVGAMDETLRPTAFSANDGEIDLFAPGAGILAAQMDGSYGFVEGTAAAAAQVAGVAVLQIALYGQATFDSMNGMAVVYAPPRDTRYLELYVEEVYPLAREFIIPLRQVLEANRNHLPPEPRFVVTAFRQEGDWAKITLLPPLFISDVPTRRIEAMDDYIVEVVAQRMANGSWQMQLVGSPFLEAISSLVPSAVVNLRAPLPQLAGGYRFPWQSGQQWWAINGWHDGNAIDFQPARQIGFAVLAAESGFLREVCYDGFQSLLQIRHADGNETYYLHVSPNPVLRRAILDQPVQRGQYLGDLIPSSSFRRACGEGFSRHLHFASAERGIMIEGVALEAIAANASCCARPPEYLSGNLRVEVTSNE
jgi:hypothetical protein